MVLIRNRDGADEESRAAASHRGQQAPVEAEVEEREEATGPPSCSTCHVFGPANMLLLFLRHPNVSF